MITNRVHIKRINDTDTISHKHQTEYKSCLKRANGERTFSKVTITMIQEIIKVLFLSVYKKFSHKVRLVQISLC